MPNLRIADYAPMTRKLVAAGAFNEDPVVLVDLGSRGGIDTCWKNFGPALRVIGFELDPEECARLNAQNEKNVRHIPAAVGDKVGRRTLHIMRFPASTSFYPVNMPFCRRFGFAENGETLRTVEVETTTLSEALAGADVDFIKLDIEGAEVDALRAADLGPVQGLVAEVRFTARMQNCPTFTDLDNLCVSQGFELYDLDLYRYARKSLPYPFLYDFRDQQERPVEGPTTQGQLLTGDALYFRDGLVTAKPLKLACLFEIFGLVDCAAEIIQAHRPAFAKWADADELLDLLVPEVKGKRLGYREHMARVAARDPRFRPTPGARFAEPVFSHSLYDGVQIPAWASLNGRLLVRLGRWLLGLKDVYRP
jgi:FkbM family methyltransferase